MRIITLIFGVILFAVVQSQAQAGYCPGGCGGAVCAPSDTCGYQNLLVGACAIYDTYNMQCYPQYSSCNELQLYESNPLACPTNLPEGETCSSGCQIRNGSPCYVMEASFGTGCFEESAPVWCCPSITPTPPDTGSCSCNTWTNGACGGGGCPSNQRYQTRTCTPSGCSSETRCIADTACDSSDPFTLTVRLRAENDSYLSGNVCQQASSTAQNVSSGSILVYNDSGFGQSQALSNSSSAAFALTTAGYYDVMVSVPVSDALQFTCPATVSESGGNYTAFYSDIYIGPTTNTTLDLFLRDNNLAADWFQVMGGLAYTNNRLRSPVPSVTCGPHASCIDALLTLLTSTEPSSAGVPFLYASDALNLQTSSHQSSYHDYISPSDKTPNYNSYATSFRLPNSSYQALRALITPAELHAVSTAQNPTDWRTQTWWQSGGDNFVEMTGDLTVTEASNYQIANGESLTVFVNGNLTLNDSNTGDTNRKITSVASGGFLAFIVSGDILVRNRVGWALNPAAPSIPALTQANSNLEGVFIADGTLTLQSNAAVSTALPDRKFIGHGTFVGWSGVALDRSFDDGVTGATLSSVQAVENFIYRPDLLAKWPEALKSASSSWREVSPTLINQ